MNIIKKLKKINDAPEKKLKSILPPNYITKNVFRVALGIMLLLVLFGAYHLDFDFKNYYSVSCNNPEGIQCLNPFYYCSHQDELKMNYSNLYAPTNGLIISNCDGLDMEEICKQGVCESKTIEVGKTLGKQKPNLDWINWLSLGILLTAFLINHTIWKVKKDGSKTDSKN